MLGSQFINEMIGIDDIIRDYENEGIMENETHVLMISDGKFSFRDKFTGDIETIEYTLNEENFDYDYSEEELATLYQCVALAESHGFYLDF